MTGEIRIKIDPGSAGVAKLEKLIQRAERKSDLLKNIGEALLETTSQRFESQTDPEGKAWAPLKPLTIEARGSSGPILTVSGRLKGSLNYEVSGDALRLGPESAGSASASARHGIRTGRHPALRKAMPPARCSGASR